VECFSETVQGRGGQDRLLLMARKSQDQIDRQRWQIYCTGLRRPRSSTRGGRGTAVRVARQRRSSAGNAARHSEARVSKLANLEETGSERPRLPGRSCCTLPTSQERRPVQLTGWRAWTGQLKFRELALCSYPRASYCKTPRPGLLLPKRPEEWTAMRTRIVMPRSWRLVDLDHMECPTSLRGSWRFREVSLRAHQESEAVSAVEHNAWWTCRKKWTGGCSGGGGCPQVEDKQKSEMKASPVSEGGYL
jgi:hypothetical protein